ncbi:MAG: hypothetical protein NTY39_07415 [Campylobacterales bacterium]|nr:hypothetical protein [Campylobacterales bacterium]
MKESLNLKYISENRLSSYNDFEEYRQNLLISKNAYIPLSILEIALRNALNTYLTIKIGRDWHTDNTFLTPMAQKKIKEVNDTLKGRKETDSKEKVIAELNFGFWVSLFQKPYQNYFRTKDLRQIFPNMPSKKEIFLDREEIYKKLDHIRRFRNRVFHYEKVINKDHYNDVVKDINFVLAIFDDALAEFATTLNKSDQSEV